VFGAALADVPLTSLKAAIGHSFGASGAVEAAAAVLAVERGVVPPSVGTEDVDPELPPCRIPLRAERCGRDPVLLLAESFGGRCAALVLKAA
jgi:3-oxoacyl-[acyl-carrier-protein] synthase II